MQEYDTVLLETEQVEEDDYSGWRSVAETNQPSYSTSNLEPQSVFIWEGEMIRIRQKYMRVGHPYAFMLQGVPVVAVKRDTGDVDFFQVPSR